MRARRRAGDWAPLAPRGPWPLTPEEPLVFTTFLGLRFRVWMFSFFIARGRGTWEGRQGQATGELLGLGLGPSSRQGR